MSDTGDAGAARRRQHQPPDRVRPARRRRGRHRARQRTATHRGRDVVPPRRVGHRPIGRVAATMRNQPPERPVTPVTQGPDGTTYVVSDAREGKANAGHVRYRARLLATTDGGRTWTRRGTIASDADNPAFGYIDAGSSSRVALLVSSDGATLAPFQQLWTSADGGRTFTRRYPARHPTFVGAMAYASDGILLLADVNSDQLWRSTPTEPTSRPRRTRPRPARCGPRAACSSRSGPTWPCPSRPTAPAGPAWSRPPLPRCRGRSFPTRSLGPANGSWDNDHERWRAGGRPRRTGCVALRHVTTPGSSRWSLIHLVGRCTSGAPPAGSPPRCAGRWRPGTAAARGRGVTGGPPVARRIT